MRSFSPLITSLFRDWDFGFIDYKSVRCVQRSKDIPKTHSKFYYNVAFIDNASSPSASSLRPAATYCSAASLRCLASFWMSLIMSASEISLVLPSAVFARRIADLMERTELRRTVLNLLF